MTKTVDIIEEVSTEPKSCRIIELPIIHDTRGNLTFIEGDTHIPFNIKRVYYLYDVPGGADRGGHAHKRLHQFLIAMSGSFDVHVDDGIAKQTFHLNRSYYGLYIPNMVWRYIDNFSSGSVCLVLASDIYDESDYYRDYEKFIEAVNERDARAIFKPNHRLLSTKV
ncbi:MAG: FdtA/QdtA family cupin domain-containing protein [bacterium]